MSSPRSQKTPKKQKWILESPCSTYLPTLKPLYVKVLDLCLHRCNGQSMFSQSQRVTSSSDVTVRKLELNELSANQYTALHPETAKSHRHSPCNQNKISDHTFTTTDNSSIVKYDSVRRNNMDKYITKTNYCTCTVWTRTLLSSSSPVHSSILPLTPLLSQLWKTALAAFGLKKQQPSVRFVP